MMNLPQTVVQHVLLPLMDPVDVAHLACTSRQFRSDIHANLAGIRRGSDVFQRMSQFVDRKSDEYHTLQLELAFSVFTDVTIWSNRIQFLDSIQPRGAKERMLGSDLFGVVPDDDIGNHPLLLVRNMPSWFQWLRGSARCRLRWPDVPVLRKWREVCTNLDAMGYDPWEGNPTITYVDYILHHEQFEELLMTDRLPHQLVNFEPWKDIHRILWTMWNPHNQWVKRNQPYIMRLLSDPVSLAMLRQLAPDTDIAPVIADYDRRHSPARHG